MVADLAPDFEYVASGAVPGAGGVFRGTDGLRRFMEAFWGEFDDTRIEVHEFIDAGDQVVVSSTLQGRGKQSGAEATWNNVPQVWNLRDGKVVHGQGFMSRHDALEAAGLSE